MVHDIAHRLTAAWNANPAIQIGTTVWVLHLCGVIEIGRERFVQVVARGPQVHWFTLPITETSHNLTILDVNLAIAATLKRTADRLGLDVIRDARCHDA